MITLKTDSDIQTLLDQPSYWAIIAFMKNDCVEYARKFGAKEKEWIPWVIVAKGSEKMSVLGFIGLLDLRIIVPFLILQSFNPKNPNSDIFINFVDYAFFLMLLSVKYG